MVRFRSFTAKSSPGLLRNRGLLFECHYFLSWRIAASVTKMLTLVTTMLTMLIKSLIRLAFLKISHARSSFHVAGVTVMESLAAEELKQPWVDPGYTGDHPKIADRIQYISELVERKGYRIHRKTVLKLLRPIITEDKGILVFKVDETEILRGKATPALKQYCLDASEVIDASLQMETPAYDIRLTKWNGADAVSIGVARLMISPVPDSTSTMQDIRRNLVDALGESHKKHPIANYNL